MLADLNIPPDVIAAIREHVSRQVAHAESGYASSQSEEDSLTGAVFDALRTADRLVQVSSGPMPGPWRWSIDFAKLPSKGSTLAAESVLGADGVIEILVRGVEGVQRKAALFQAKNGSIRSLVLQEQCAKMSVWREAAFVVHYTAAGYFVYSIDDCLHPGSSLNRQLKRVPLATWLIENFIGCLVGDQRLRYDKHSMVLYWARDRESRESEWQDPWVSVSFSPKHLVQLEVVAPDWHLHDATRISRTDVPASRLAFSPRRLFGFDGPFTFGELKNRRLSLIQSYHPDRHSRLAKEAVELLTTRTQEINAAYEWLLLEVSRDQARQSPETPHQPGPLNDATDAALGLNRARFTSRARAKTKKSPR